LFAPNRRTARGSGGERVSGKGPYYPKFKIWGDQAACFWIGRYVREVRRAKREEVCTEQGRSETTLFLDMVKESRMHVNTLKNIVDEYVQKSSLNKRVTPHTFRQTCATHLLKHGADIRHIQTLLGHASPETTQHYARVEISDLEEVFRQTHPRASL